MKIGFRALLFVCLQAWKDYLATLFLKRVIKISKSHSSDSQTVQFASGHSLLSLRRLFSVSSKTYC